MIPPLAIVQARLHSTRLREKMLQALNGHPVIWYTWATAIKQFSFPNVVVAVPCADQARFVAVLPNQAQVFGWRGPQEDVLGRVHACANKYRKDPSARIYRITPDDWPPVLFRDRTTLAELNRWHAEVTDPRKREHIGLLFRSPQYEINTAEDLELVRAEMA